MSNVELPLVYAIQRYIYDYIATGGRVTNNSVTGFENMNIAEYLAVTLIEHGWIKDEI